ncbi:MAG: hypothetical protein WCE44_08125 [Candidatus Velthaea sp.]|jgi:nitrile hydratase
MSRLNDVGGLTGFGPVERETDEPPFHSEWEARVFALNRLLLGQGVYDLDQFRDAVERIDPIKYYGLSYYERWFEGVRMLLIERGIVPPETAA